MIESLGQGSASSHPMHELHSGLTYESFAVQKFSEEFRYTAVYPEDRLASWRS